MTQACFLDGLREIVLLNIGTLWTICIPGPESNLVTPFLHSLFFALFSSTSSPETPDCSTWLTGSTCNLNPAHTAPHSPTAGLRKNPKLTFPPFSQGAVKNSRKPFNYRWMEVRERERERKNGERQSTVQVPGVFLACPETGSHNGFSG